MSIKGRTPKLGLMLAALVVTLAAVPVEALEQRTLSQRFPITEGDTLRLANLAGRLELESTSGSEVEVIATIFAAGKSAGQTEELLNSMNWVEARDRQGRREWALSYPVDRYRTFRYPGSDARHDDHDESFWGKLFSSFDMSRSNTRYLGERVSVVRGGSAPTLYADLVVRFPTSGSLVVRNMVGRAYGGDLAGDLTVDTGSGSVDIDSFEGRLNVDTGSGTVKLGSVSGELLVDTGSGSIYIDALAGSGELDTGSGKIDVGGVDSDSLVADTGSGSIAVRNGRVGHLIADTGSGGIKVLDVDVEVFEADTGSGSVTLQSSLLNARDVEIDTGSGSVKIYGHPSASFYLTADQGSGSFRSGYEDAKLIMRGREVVGAERGDRKTRIRVDTGSGSCTIAPKGG